MATTDELATRLTALEARVDKLDGGTPALPAPTNVRAALQPDKGIKITWGAVEGAASYDVANVAGGAPTNVTGLTLTTIPVPPGNYSFTVTAVAATGKRGVTSPQASVSVPVESGGVTVTGARLNDLQVKIDWATDRTDVSGWIVSRSGIDSVGSGPWTSGTLGAGIRTFTFGNLTKTVAYDLRVVGKTPTGDIAATFTTKVETAPNPNPQPTTGSAATNFNWGPVVGGDEFTGDLSKWDRYDGPGHNGNGRRVPGAFTIENGILVCTGRQNGDTGGMAYIGGGVGSARTYRDEVRARMFNTGAGSGAQYHPVLIRWPDSDDWPRGGEDDFMETDIGSGRAGWFIHHPNQGSGSAQSGGEFELDITQWHNYAIERSGSRVKVFIDGIVRADYSIAETNGQVPGPMHPTIQLDNFNGGQSHREARFEVDYYRIYGPPA